MSQGSWLGITTAGLMLAFAAWWWMPPGEPLSEDAFQLLMSTYSAAKSEDVRRLDAVEAAIASTPLPSHETEPIEELVRIARAGDWERAASAAFELMQRQQRSP